MPSKHIVPQNYMSNLTTSMATTVDMLEVLARTFKTPFLESITLTSRSLLTLTQAVKHNRDDCSQLMEQTCQLLHAIIVLHLESKAHGELSPAMLKCLGTFQSIQTTTCFGITAKSVNVGPFIRSMPLLEHKGEKVGSSNSSNKGEQMAGVNILKDLSEMQDVETRMHQEVLELVATMHEDTSSDQGSSIRAVSSYNRIAILGPGGMGKTSLARAVLHRPEIKAKYQQYSFFVACDSASTKVELAALIGAHLGLKPGKNLTAVIINLLSSSPPCLLILDNLETLWEPIGQRRDIEEFLTLLTDIEHLAIMPLGQAAAQQTFIDIADGFHDRDEMDQVLLLTDNIPLVINLIAHVVDEEGCTSVLSRWEKEKTAIVSKGYDQRSSLDSSISLSLSSPRMMSIQQTKELLSLLSMLPDGLSGAEFQWIKLPVKDILRCRNDDKRKFYHAVASYYDGSLMNYSTATTFYRTALSLSVLTQNFRGQAHELQGLALIEWKRGHYYQGQIYALESQKAAKIAGKPYNEANGLRAEALCCYALSDYKHTAVLCKAARDILVLLGLAGGDLDVNIMNIQAEVHMLKSEYVKARSIHTQILDQVHNKLNLISQGYALFNIAEIDLKLGTAASEVEETLARAMTIFSAKKYRAEVRCLGDVSRWHHIDWPQSWTVLFLVHGLSLKNKLAVYKALQFLADRFLAERDQVTATNLYNVALDAFTQMDVHRSRAECMLSLGDITKGNGNPEKAEELWKTARPLFELSSQMKNVVLVDERLSQNAQEKSEKETDMTLHIKLQVSSLPEAGIPIAEGPAQNEDTKISIAI
ncbi:hypothetical protein B0H13DRAFT_1883201 [Mycena leptocephala]|nr:hypothetical protein B0H13DRAFT_1883201 [Mycena leptocephala]